MKQFLFKDFQGCGNPVLSINFLHLSVSEIWPGQDFIGQGHYGKVKDEIKVTP